MNNNYREIISKLGKLDNTVIFYENFQNVLNRIDECILKTQAYSRSENCIIAAEPGMGKTFVADYLLSIMKEEDVVENDCDITTVPCFYMEVPANTTPLMLAGAMLTAMGETGAIRGNLVEQTQRLLRLFEKCRVKLVIIDEFQNMMTKTAKNHRLSRGVIEWVKQLSNASKVTYCLMGSAEFLPFLIQDPHTKKRFMDVLPFKPLTPPIGNDDGTLAPYYYSYCEIAKSIFPKLTLPEADDDLFIMQLFLATQGLPKYISFYTKKAIQDGLNNDKFSITRNHFAEVWKQYRDAQISKTFRNPFLLDRKAIAMTLKGN